MRNEKQLRKSASLDNLHPTERPDGRPRSNSLSSYRRGFTPQPGTQDLEPTGAHTLSRLIRKQNIFGASGFSSSEAGVSDQQVSSNANPDLKQKYKIDQKQEALWEKRAGIEDILKSPEWNSEEVQSLIRQKNQLEPGSAKWGEKCAGIVQAFQEILDASNPNKQDELHDQTLENNRKLRIVLEMFKIQEPEITRKKFEQEFTERVPAFLSREQFQEFQGLIKRMEQDEGLSKDEFEQIETLMGKMDLEVEQMDTWRNSVSDQKSHDFLSLLLEERETARRES